MKTINNRTTNYETDDLFLKRYSPRSMSGETITKDELMTLFDAAHWAPSLFNEQPWRFIYGMRGTPAFDKLFSFLMEGNQIWCKNAAALILVISKNKTSRGDEDATHSFDTGAAWENLALQATTMGLVSHGMAGLDYVKAKEGFLISDDYKVEMMIAIGKTGKIEDLPENLREREKPSDRKPLEEIIFEGEFKN